MFGTARKKCPATLRVFVGPGVTRRFTQEILGNPEVEVGGKYVGFIRGTKRAERLDERQEAMERLELHVVDYIDDGPRADRTATFHRGDTEFQIQEFRRLEKRYPEIEHLGSWHSHHPNQLRSLSPGDIEGYRETVNAQGHNHDFFFASLGTDSRGFASARHFLFVRGDKHYYELAPENLIVADGPPAPTGPAGGAGGTLAVPGPAAQGNAPLSVPGWTDSPQGQERLARDRDLIAKYGGLRHVVRSDRIAVTGQVVWAGRVPVTLHVLYPTSTHTTDGLLKVTVAGGQTLEVSLTGDRSGDLAFALEAVESIARCAADLHHRAQHRRAGPPARGGQNGPRP
ncbi:hypothetical protein [Streptomyces maremycinicus]|uniref:hypothetical protein n=1 Tax=Streptomyces maremycinicus TaxID=1679753 RepID=UPI000788060A|nr:hypothetical protein [Streptomyces sp. NBRC 110468]